MLTPRRSTFFLFPFTARELGPRFDLHDALRWGTLPKVCALSDDRDRSRFLRTYAQTYLKEEILIEQLIRNLDPFRLFLRIAAQMNSQIKDDVEVDLLIDRPGAPLVLVEIKSSADIDERHIRNLLRFEKDFPEAVLICASRVSRAQKIGRVSVLPWAEALDTLF